MNLRILIPWMKYLEINGIVRYIITTTHNENVTDTKTSCCFGKQDYSHLTIFSDIAINYMG